MRMVPHPANFAPIGALALFGGIYLPKRFALVIPLGAMIVSDIFIGFYTWQIMIAVYSSFILSCLIGLWVRSHKTALTVLGGALAGSFIFFFITNAAVWAFSGMYPFTFQGLSQSYLMGLPFLRNTLAGDLFYTTFLVGSFEALKKILPQSHLDLGVHSNERGRVGAIADRTRR